MDKIEQLEKEIKEIKQRNARVEEDKEWETSDARKVIIALVTYVLIGVYMTFLGISRPWLNAIVPTTGFILSTLTLSWARSIWIKIRER